MADRIVLFANTGWYLYNFRRGLAEELRRRGWDVVLLSPPDPYAEQLAADGFRWVPVDLDRRGRSPLRDLKTLWEVWHVYRRLRPSLVHHFTIKPVIYGSIAARMAGVPGVVNAVTGLGYVFLRPGLAGRLLRGLVFPLYRFGLSGGRVVFQNEHDRALFLRLGLVSPGQSTVIRGSGVDLKRFRPAPEPPGPPVAVMVSRMLWDKGVGDLVEAARILRAQGSDLRVWLVGGPDPGNPSSIPEERLSEWSREGVVEWLGRREDVETIYAASHIVVLPSYREGVPRSLLEGAACGRPLVATDVPGCREVVVDGENGLLVPPGDAVALAAALQRLAGDPQARRRLGRNARRLVEREFSEERVVADTLAVYEELVPWRRAETKEGQALPPHR